MTRLRIPVFLHEAFGETQSAAEIALVLVFGALGTIAMILLEPRPFDTTPWRATLAALLTFDVFAGALANLTRGTNARAGCSLRCTCTSLPSLG